MFFLLSRLPFPRLVTRDHRNCHWPLHVLSANRRWQNPWYFVCIVGNIPVCPRVLLLEDCMVHLEGLQGLSFSNIRAVWKFSKTEFFGLQSDLICITWGLVGYLFLGLGYKVTLFNLKIMAKFWNFENLLASSVNERLCKSFAEVFYFVGGGFRWQFNCIV